MTNPSKRDTAVKKVVSAGRLIVTYQIGLTLGAQRMSNALSWLAPYEKDLPQAIFHEYRTALLGLPIGTERLEWDRAALREKDVRLEAVNQKYRDRIFETCWALLDRFDGKK